MLMVTSKRETILSSLAPLTCYWIIPTITTTTTINILLDRDARGKNQYAAQKNRHLNNFLLRHEETAEKSKVEEEEEEELKKVFNFCSRDGSNFAFTCATTTVAVDAGLKKEGGEVLNSFLWGANLFFALTR